MRHQLMFLYVLGPGNGTFELQPIRHEDSPAYNLDVKPGTVVIVRTDALSHKFLSGKCHVLSCFLNHDTLDGIRGDALVDDLVPCARELLTWVEARLKKLAEEIEVGEEGPSWDP